MGIFDRKQKYHTLKEMKLISAIVATATAAVVQTGQWNGVDNDNTCGATYEWQDANGDVLSLVNATCSWQSNSAITYAYVDNGGFVASNNAVTGLAQSGDAALRFFFAQSCVNGTCDNSTCWDITIDCQANPNNVALPGLYIQENINDHRGDNDNWNLQVAGVNQGDVISFDFGGSNDVYNLTTDFGAVSGSGNTWAVSVQDAPFGELLQLTVYANEVVDLFSTTVE